MAQSLINAKELLARMPADGGVAGGGGEGGVEKTLSV